MLEIKVEAIYDELCPLVEHLRQGLERLGCDLLTPCGLERASGIVTFNHPRADLIGALLERDNIIVWAGDGRVRTSVHLYNDLADVDRCLTALTLILSRPEIADSKKRG